jgi:hypothetical protein
MIRIVPPATAKMAYFPAIRLPAGAAASGICRRNICKKIEKFA